MDNAEKTLVLGARFRQSEVDTIREVTGMSDADFVRRAISETMQKEYGINITGSVGKRGGQAGNKGGGRHRKERTA
jgi:hypothetical protein